jgi:hypothetical protein
MITNKNKVMTAPTYTNTNTKAKNSAFTNNHNTELEKNPNTKNKTLRTGLACVTIITADNTVKLAKQ